MPDTETATVPPAPLPTRTTEGLSVTGAMASSPSSSPSASTAPADVAIGMASTRTGVAPPGSGRPPAGRHPTACAVADPAVRPWAWAPAPGVIVAVVPIDDILASAVVLDRLRPEERAAAGAMAPWRAREHLAGRALLRLLLTGPLGEAGARSPLVPEPGGRPRLPGFPRTGVNVSHSGPYVAAAVATGLDVGVDVQTPKNRHPECCAAAVLPGRRQGWRNCPPTGPRGPSPRCGPYRRRA
ncbi:hypothetical protein STENM223S_10458 [Streptomyces tendae]